MSWVIFNVVISDDCSFPCHQTSVPVCSVECAFITMLLFQNVNVYACVPHGIFVLSLLLSPGVCAVGKVLCLVWFGFGL